VRTACRHRPGAPRLRGARGTRAPARRGAAGMTTLSDQAARALISGTEGLDQTLFVEAGAGSGKTTELIARLTRLIDRGVELRHIAAITFTEKAAQELRDRLRGALSRGLAT